MSYTTIVFGLILIALGLHGYFDSPDPEPSLTALIPVPFGAVLAVCGIIARNPKLKMHVMHAAVLVGLLGFLLAGGRAAMSLGKIISDDASIHRGPRLVGLMALICGLFVAVCIWSFISARRRRLSMKAGDTTIAGG
jgi:hypothetical protein